MARRPPNIFDGPFFREGASQLLALEFPIWLVTRRELQTSPKIRIVLDELARGFRRTLEATTPAAEQRAGARQGGALPDLTAVVTSSRPLDKLTDPELSETLTQLTVRIATAFIGRPPPEG